MSRFRRLEFIAGLATAALFVGCNSQPTTSPRPTADRNPEPHVAEPLDSPRPTRVSPDDTVPLPLTLIEDVQAGSEYEANVIEHHILDLETGAVVTSVSNTYFALPGVRVRESR